MKRLKSRGIAPTAMLMAFLCLMVILCLTMDSLELTLSLRTDLSFNAMTTLSAPTEEILAEIKKPVHIYALYKKGEEELPLLEFLNRYHVINNLVTWEQTDVTQNPALVTRFASDAENNVTQGSLIVYCEETGRFRVLKSTDFLAYGYDIELGTFDVEAYNYEKRITEAMIYVTRDEIPQIAILQGHGELDAGAAGILTSLLTSNNYGVSFVNLIGGDRLPEDSLLMILSPQKDLLDSELAVITEHIGRGNSLFITCDYDDPVEKMPNYLSLLRLYGFVPLDGIVVASDSEPGTFLDGYPIAIRPQMLSTAATSALVTGGEDLLILNVTRAFLTPQQTDSRLKCETVLVSTDKAYLFNDAYRDTLEQRDTDETGPFSMALLAERMMDTTELSRAFISGNSSLFINDHQGYDDRYVFTLRVVQYLLSQEPISLAIEQKPAFRPGLAATSQNLGIALIIFAPLAVLFAALVVLVPRRHR